jgi:hypothetical protein
MPALDRCIRALPRMDSDTMIFVAPIVASVTPVTAAEGTVTCILRNYSFHPTSYVIDERTAKQDEIFFYNYLGMDDREQSRLGSISRHMPVTVV